MKHLLKLSDLSTQEILDILNMADQLKYDKKNGSYKACINPDCDYLHLGENPTPIIDEGELDS